METVADFIFGAPKSLQMVTAAMKLKRPWLGIHPEETRSERDMFKLDSILRSRDVTLPTNVCLVKDIVFPVFMYGCESWTVKKCEC